MITWAFDAELRGSQPTLQKELPTNQREMVFNSTLTTRYYHIELLSSKIAMFLYGTLKISRDGMVVREFKIDGFYWLANLYIVDIGWFKSPKKRLYTFTLSGIDGSKGRITIRIKESPLSSLMPTYRLLQLSVVVIFFGAVLGVLFQLTAKKETEAF